MEALPSIAVLVGGGLLKAILGGICASHAEKLARSGNTGRARPLRSKLLAGAGAGVPNRVVSFSRS
jgi:hypothetical protein